MYLNPRGRFIYLKILFRKYDLLKKYYQKKNSKSSNRAFLSKMDYFSERTLHCSFASLQIPARNESTKVNA